MKWVKWRWLVVSLNESDCVVVPNQWKCTQSVEVYPIRNSTSQKLQVRLVAFWTLKQPQRRSPSISLFFFKFPWGLGGGGGGGGGHAPRPSYLLRELPFLRPRSVHPQSKKSSYVYANYHLTQAIQCYQKNCKGSCIHNLYMLVLTGKNWTSYICHT